MYFTSKVSTIFHLESNLSLQFKSVECVLLHKVQYSHLFKQVHEARAVPPGLVSVALQ